jgi:hypothetical protein
MEKRKKGKSSANGNELRLYLNILKYGLINALKTRLFGKGLMIADEYSEVIKSFKIRTPEDH